MKVKEVDQRSFLTSFESRLSEMLSQGNSVLDEGMRYAMLDGGKRIRPLCVYFGARAAGGDVDTERIISLALGVEFIHGYSLVHDDLPAMDNDDYRRGKLSVHKKFGHANGILIGDQLLTQALCLLLDGSVNDDGAFAKAAYELASAAKNMAYGQAADLQGCETSEKYLEMYSQKTGALISGALKAGAICAGANSDMLSNIESFAKSLGLAFQLADDLIDDGKDNSILSIIGVDGAKAMLKEQTTMAYEFAERFDNRDELTSFAQRLCIRNK